MANPQLYTKLTGELTWSPIPHPQEPWIWIKEPKRTVGQQKAKLIVTGAGDGKLFNYDGTYQELSLINDIIQFQFAGEILTWNGAIKGDPDETKPFSYLGTRPKDKKTFTTPFQVLKIQ